MDILSNLLIPANANSNQLNDLSDNLSQAENCILDKKLKELDAIEGISPEQIGEFLPPNGNNQPMMVDFASMLKQEITLSDEQQLQPVVEFKLTQNTFNEFTLNEQHVTLSLDNISNEDILNEVKVFPELEESSVIANYEVDKTVVQHNETLAQMMKKPLLLKEVSSQIIDQQTQTLTEIEKFTSALNSMPATPSFFQNNTVDSESKFDLNDEISKITEETKEGDAPVIAKETQEKSLQNYKEIVITQIKEDSKISLTSDRETPVHEQTSQTEAPPSTEYQIAANQTVSRKIESSNLPKSTENIIHKESFQQDLNQKLQLMLNANENSAKFELSPADLGKIEIKIVQDADKTHITFITSQMETQELIESSLERLKSQVEMHGLNLGNVTVSHGNAQHQQQLPRQNPFNSNNLLGQADSQGSSQINTTMPTGMLDLYA